MPLTRDRMPFLGFLLALALAGPSATAQQLAPEPNRQEQQAQPSSAPAVTGFVELAKPLIPAVVNISAEHADATPAPDGEPPIPGLPEGFRDFFGPRDQEPGQAPQRTAVGSGFIIDPGGLIVTNSHVVANAVNVTVVLHDETEHEAEVVGTDPRTDLAVLRIRVDSKLPHVRWGDSGQAEVGEAVLAIGNPFGLGGTVTAGIISALARDLGVGPYDEFLQTDASINRGNSGGPLFNMRGEVIGVTTAIFSPTGSNIGIGFAIPSAIAQSVIDQLSQNGEVRRGWIGISFQPVDESLAKALGLKEPQGTLVANVSAGAPADQAGIEIGDVILEFAGKPIGRDNRLPQIVAGTAIGSTVPVTLWRDGQTLTAQLTVGDMKQAQEAAEATPEPEPDAARPDDTTPQLGLSLAPLTPELREKLDVATDVEGGVLIADVAAGSAAAQGGVMPGDVIMQIDRKPVSKPDDVVAAMREAVSQGRNDMLMLLRRADNNLFVAIPIAKG